MADTENTNMDSDKKKGSNALKRRVGEDSHRQETPKDEKDIPESCTTAEYCEKLQAWMCQYSTGFVTWQSWLAASAAMSYPCVFQSVNGTSTARLDHNVQYYGAPLSLNAAASGSPSSRGGEVAGGAAVPTQPQQLPQENGNARRPGREYTIPSPLQRLLAEIVDFFILFFIKATIIISIMHLSGIKDVSKFAMHFIIDEIDEETSMEELQKMMLFALVYPILVCFYELSHLAFVSMVLSEGYIGVRFHCLHFPSAFLRCSSSMVGLFKFTTVYVVHRGYMRTSLRRTQHVKGPSKDAVYEFGQAVFAARQSTTDVYLQIVCIWGAGGATPGKFLIGLRVVTCDSSVLVQPNRVLVVPATDVSLSASTVRALSKNFSIAFFFPAFVTLLFFQHNRTVYDMVAGTIVVKRSRVR